MRALTTPWLVVSVLALGLTLQVSDGFYAAEALPGLGLAMVTALLGIAGAPWPSTRSWRHGGAAARSILVVGVLASATALLTRPLLWYAADPQPWTHPWLLAVIAAMTATALLSARPRGRHRTRASAAGVLVLLAGGLLIGAWTVRASPAPHIDVIPVHVEGFAALARGESPYAITFDDMYRADEAMYAPELRANGKVLFGFPYPPLSLLMAWPGQALFGDLRYSEVLAVVVTAGLLAWMRSGTVGVLCAAMLLLAPRLPFALEQGWTEPFPMMLLALTVWTALRVPAWAWLPLGLLVASKQHMVLALLFAPWLIAAHGRALGPRVTDGARAPRQRLQVGGVLYLKTLAVAAVVTLPMALMDLDAFYKSAVLLQLREPLRLDSLSFTRLLVALGWALDRHGAVLLSVAAGGIGIGLAWWRAPRTPAGFAAALGLTTLLLTAFGKKAFLNYYMFVAVALLIAIAAASGPARSVRAAQVGDP